MARQKQRVFWSIMLIIFGVIFLLQNFRVLHGVGDLMWAGLFGTAGVIGFSYALKNKAQWWVMIPGAVFVAIAVTVVTDTLNILSFTDGGLFMLILSVAFWGIFITQKSQWWAAIPAGVLSSIGFMVMVEQYTRFDVAPLLFIGMGLTFGLLWLIRAETPTDWAIWPAIGLLAFGLFLPGISHLDSLWPLILIGVGSWMLLKNVARNRRGIDAGNAPLSTPIEPME